MKIISIIGSSVQKTLLPLLQFRVKVDSAVFIVQKCEYDTYFYAKSFIDEKKQETGWNFSYWMKSVANAPDYDSFYESVEDILMDSFSRGEETAVNISGGNAHMILAAVQAAKAMRVPVMYVDSNKLDIQTVRWRQEVPGVDISTEHFNMNGIEVKDVLALCNFRPAHLNPDENLPGIQYERLIYREFLDARDAGLFDSIDRNIILTWNPGKKGKNEIDIVFLRKGLIGFVSVKSGSGVQTPSIIKKTSKELRKTYPQWLLRRPCLRVLISRYPVSEDQKKVLSSEDVMVFDNVFCENDIRNVIGKIVAYPGNIAVEDQDDV